MFLLERTVSGKVGNRRKTEPGTTGADFFAVRYRFACDRRYLRWHLFAFATALGSERMMQSSKIASPETLAADAKSMREQAALLPPGRLRRITPQGAPNRNVRAA
jgi:hypothetical protein